MRLGTAARASVVAAMAATALAQSPGTYAGRTLAQWLRPGSVASVGQFPVVLEAEVTRERALAAFGVTCEPLEFLHRVVRDPGEPPELALALETIPALAQRPQFAADLLARWRAQRGHAPTLAALLAVDRAVWPVVEPELREHLGAAMQAAGIAFDDPLFACVPPAALDAGTAWTDLLGLFLDRAGRLPPPAALPAVFRHHARLVPAILRIEGGTLPSLAWLEVVQRCAPELAAQLAPLETDLRIELATLKKSVAAWSTYPDTDRPALDPTRARQLGSIGPPALGLATLLEQDADPDTSHAGRLALGQMARGEPAARARLIALLRDDAAAAGVQFAPRAAPGQLILVPRWPLPPTLRTRSLHDALRIAGEPIVDDLMVLLGGAEPAATRIAALDCLRAMWALPYSSGALLCPTAAPRIEPLLPLLAAADPDLRDAALRTAVGVAPFVPMQPAGFAALDADARAAADASPQLRVAAWRCWANDGAWLLCVAEQCQPRVAEMLRIVAQTSPGTQPLTKTPPSTVQGLYHGPWYHRVLASDRAAKEPGDSEVLKKLAELAASDPDRLVREHSRAAQTALAK